ncbi:hypothetical protein [Pontivivens ytuae]|uniref:DUF4440 domain-containing protein n=1 Tax=Pontivivens ytuae TaxID=2789856 RepID=A0A7S9LNF0_9RHOB|nr:hypothetical protein [Pontivivens ytuae]QPH52227.1 hypothetical protein I0K15_10290 [Pontivivens ytuae]
MAGALLTATSAAAQTVESLEAAVESYLEARSYDALPIDLAPMRALLADGDIATIETVGGETVTANSANAYITIWEPLLAERAQSQTVTMDSPLTLHAAANIGITGFTARIEGTAADGSAIDERQNVKLFWRPDDAGNWRIFREHLRPEGELTVIEPLEGEAVEGQ